MYDHRALLNAALLLLLPTLTLLSPLTAGARTRPPIDRESGVNLVRFVGTGTCGATAFTGTTLAIANGGSVEFYNLSVPAAPALLGAVTLDAPARFIISDPGVTYVLSGDAINQTTIWRINTSNPNDPTIASSISLSGNHTAFTRIETRLYLSGTTATTIMDAASLSPVGVTSRSTTVVGNSDNLYLADSSTLRVMDNSVPINPPQVGTLGFSFSIFDLGLSDDGNTVFVGLDGILSVDVTDPTKPTQIGAYDSGNSRFYSDIEVTASGVYGSHSNGEVRLLDASTPETLGLLGAFTSNTQLKCVAATPSLANITVAGAGTGAVIMDFSTPQTPTQAAFIHTGHSIGDILVEPDTQRRGGTSTTHVTTASGRGGVQRFSVSNDFGVIGEQTPLFVGAIGSELDYRVVAPAGIDLVFAGRTNALETIDFGGSSPSVVANTALTGTPASTDADGFNLAISLGPNGRYSVVNVANPTTPAVVNTIDALGDAQDVSWQVGSGLLAVALGGNGPAQVKLFDLSSPTSPVLVKGFSPGTNVQSTLVDGSRLYLADFDQWIYVYDIADPANPSFLGSHNLGVFSQIQDLAVGLAPTARGTVDTYLYAALSEAGLVVLNVTNPALISVVGSYDTGAEATSVVLHNDVIYVGDGPGGWYALQLDPTTPTLISSFDARATDAGAIELRWLVTSDENLAGFQVRRARAGTAGSRVITDGLLPANTSVFVDFMADRGVTYNYELVVVKADGDWLRSPLVTITTPRAATRLFDNYPNPFNPTTTIAFELATSQRAQVTVFNAAGQRVATLADRLFPAGRSEVMWNGKDDAGGELASGVYVYQVRTAQQRLSGKMVMLK